VITTGRKQNDQETHSPGNQWQVIYCSFALILVVFFVMILANSVVSGKNVSLVQRQFSLGGGIPQEHYSHPSSFAVLHDAAKQLQIDQAVTLEMTSSGINIALPDHLFFAPDKNSVETHIFPYLNVVGDVIAKNGFNLQIEVYGALSGEKSDTRESRQLSWEQAASRTVNIMQYFLAYGRLSPGQVTASGFVSQESKGNHITGKGKVELHLAVNDNQ
jgi:flagellar motor protein MotB